MTLILDRYRLDTVPLGQGGMGVVWAARDEKLGRRVAVKCVRFPDEVPDPRLEARFIHEAKILSRLSHPGAPMLHDFGTYEEPPLGSRLFMVMQFIEGNGVDQVLAEHGPLRLGWVASIGAQVAAVLAAAHELGILHRDLKPSNLMLRRDGSVQVVDFGVALMHDPELTKLTASGDWIGSPAYMSPEQVRFEEATARSDVYALGAVLYELLTGRHVFTGGSGYVVMDHHVRTRPAAAGLLRPDVPRELDELILAMLEKRPEDRPGTAAEVHERLMPYLAGTGPLGDMTDPRPSPARMYAHAAARTLTGGVTPPAPGAREDDRTREDVALARRQATSLVRRSQYGDAAQVLRDAVRAADGRLGADEVIDLRVRLADVLLDGGDHRGAAEQYRRAAAELLALAEPDLERVFQCRLQEATCHLHTGDQGLALHVLRELLADELTRWPGDDARLLELRRQIGELEAAAGHTEQARRTLSTLRDDLVRLYGPDHAATARVVELLNGIEG